MTGSGTQDLDYTEADEEAERAFDSDAAGLPAAPDFC